MRLSPKCAWFLAFTAAFAALAGFVFWGTWSTGFAPVMPDNPIVHPPWWISDWWRGWLETGRFVPGDLLAFLGGPGVWQELKYAFSLYLAALGMAYFCRGRGLSEVAACGAGLLLAFCGYWLTLFSAGHYGWFQWMAYGVFAFGLADRAVRGGGARHWALLGATVAWGSFYQPDLWLLFTVFTGAYLVRCCVRERKLPWKGALLAAAAFAVIGAPSVRHAFVSDLAGRDRQIAEGQTVGGNVADDAEKRWIFATNWSMPPDETLEFLVRGANGDTSCPFTLSIGAQRGTGVRPYTGALGRPKDAPSGNYRQHSLYVGWVTCLLALGGLVAGCRRRDTRSEVAFFAVAAVVFWLFSLGRYCEPVYRLVYALPFGDYLRAPVKWHHLTEFCLVVLAAFGLDALRGALAVRLKPALALAAVAAVALVGATDLAVGARRSCAPVDIREARRQNANLQMAFLRKSDFENPSVAAMVRAHRIVPLANPNAETYLVGVIEPWRRADEPPPPFSAATGLGIVSALATFAALALAAAGAWPARRKGAAA